MFAGCGRVDRGVRASDRADLVWAYDIDLAAVETHRRNLPTRPTPLATFIFDDGWRAIAERVE
jgi:site-specific DNA-cytosine methylase